MFPQGLSRGLANQLITEASPVTSENIGTPATFINDPRGLPNLTNYWRADQGVTVLNGLVSQWNDLVGGQHLTQTSTSLQPTFLHEANPCILFSASSHPNQIGYLANANIQVNPQNFYAFAIVDYGSGISPSVLLNFGNDAEWLLVSTDNNNSNSCLRTGNSGGTTSYAGQYVPHGKSLVGVIGPSTGTAITFVNDKIATASTTFPATTWTGFAVGNTVGAFSSWGTYKVYEVGLLNVSQPAFGLQSVVTFLTNYAQNTYGIVRGAYTKNIVFGGDSISSGIASTSLRGWNNRDLLGLNVDTQTWNSSYSGRLVSAFADTTMLTAKKSTTAQNVYVLFGGTNDINVGTGQEPTLQTNFTTAINAALAQGYQVIVCTMLPRTVGGNANQEADRQTFNTWLRANYLALGCIDIIDFGNNSTTMGAPGANSNTTLYYTDGVHPTNYGYELLAAVARPVIQRVLYSTGNVSTAQKIVAGSTSGSATFCQPQQGPSSKEVLVNLTALVGTASYTFPTPFLATPQILTTNGPAASVVTALSATAMTVTGATTSGFIVLKGQ